MPVSKSKTTQKKVKQTVNKPNEVRIVPTEPKTDIHFYYKDSGDIDPEGVTGIWKNKYSISTLMRELRRDETTYRALKKLGGDVFDKWFKVKAFFDSNGQPHERLQLEIERLNHRVSLQENMKLTWELKMMHGKSLLGIGWEDNREETEQPINITDINTLYPISGSQISKLLVDNRKNSATYGQIIAAKIKYKYNIDNTLNSVEQGSVSIEERIIPSARFIPWINFAPGSLDYKGMSAFEPIFDMLTIKRNLDWAFGETAFQFASKKYVLIVPANVTADYWDYVVKNWKDFDSLTTFVAKGEGHRVESLGGQGQLDPRPYFDYYHSLLAAGVGVPRSILLHEGTAGSEWVVKDYYSDISAIQKNDVEPIIMELYRRLQEIGLLPRGIIHLEWNKLMELDEREASFVKSRFALGHSMQSEAISTYISSGLAVELDEEGWIKRIFVPDEKTKESEFILLPIKQSPPEQPKIPNGTVPEAPEGSLPTDIKKELIKQMTEGLVEKDVETRSQEEENPKKEKN